MTVLVTGSTGFLGTAVVERLLEHGVRQIRCFARPSSDTARLAALAASYNADGLEVVIGNLQSAADSERALVGVDTVYHLASAMRGAPAAIFLDTVVASKRLLDAIGSHPVRRLVLVSSLSVYGLADAPVDRLVDESTGLEPHPERRDPYSHAKLRQEQLVQERAVRAGFELVILRPGALYGRGGPAFSTRVGLTAAGWLLHFGGNNMLPLCHVSNCAEAVVLAGTSSRFPAGAYNVVDDDLPTAAEYVRRYKREVRHIRSIRCPFFATMLLSKWAERLQVSSRGRMPLPLTPYRTASLWRGHRFDSSRLRRAGWTQIVSTREGLAGAFDDLRARDHAAARTPTAAGNHAYVCAASARSHATHPVSARVTRVWHPRRGRPMHRSLSLPIAPTACCASSQRRIELLVVGPSLQQWLGGQEVQADLLVRHWRDDPDVRVAFVPHNPAPPRGLRWTEPVPALRTVVRLPTRLRALWRGVRRSDIVHIFSASHSSFLVATLPAWCVARLLVRRTLIHYHSGRADEHLRRSPLARYVLRHADAVVVPSRYLAEIFALHAVPADVVANAIDVAELRYRDRPVIQCRLVCTRNFEPGYAVDLVVRAFADIKKEFPSARLLLAGRGSNEAAIRALVRDLDLGQVEFCGAVPRHRIGELLDRADVFVNASRIDNMPVSILEAFAAGIPVVSAASGGIPYLVEHERTGLLSEVGDVDGLARNVRRIISDPPLARRLAGNAHEESSRYEWPAIRAEWLRLYRTLARVT